MPEHVKQNINKYSIKRKKEGRRYMETQSR